ncbi:hypothetical protein EDC39_104142 [Geothermobacter ehrlichii]|uniref:Dolichyl-phosphate-mannose-protein mannosyltransferase n=1 Tax=Geothermobacter ehrlichii TaxID=213224 RepID=A0A5D3WKV4_9BACT|nr:hypothetical protein [Geothermobacter ehrlichii]TYO99018.1 hypothetical protein EDC39_104142 [Geothermobacter ehrlichii]
MNFIKTSKSIALRGAPYVCFLIVFAYALYVNKDVVRADQWRFLFLIERFMDGSLSWNDLFMSHSHHVKPGYKILFILNAILFHLNLKLELLLGIVVHLLSLLLIRATVFGSQEDQFNSLCYVTLCLTWFSFNQVANFTYSLLSFGGFVGTFLMVFYCCLFDRALKENLSYRWMTAALFGYAGCSLLFHGARSLAALVALVLTLFFWIMARKPAVHWRRIVFFIFGLALVQLGYWSLLKTGKKVSADSSIMFVLGHPFDSVKYVLISLSAAVMPTSWMLKRGISEDIMALVGAFLVFTTIFILYLFFRYRLYEKTVVPLIFVIYSFMFVFEILVGRFGKGFPITNGASPRYVFDIQMLTVGLLIVTAIYLQDKSSFMLLRRIAFFFVSGIFVIQLIVMVNSLQRMKIVKKSQEKMAAIILSGDFSAAPRWVCPDKSLCQEKVQFLKLNHLSVFKYK